TWGFTHESLIDTMDELWLNLKPTMPEILMSLRSLPEIGTETQSLPYSFDDIHLAIPSSKMPDNSLFEKLKGSNDVPCKLCGHTVALKTMRIHVGAHLLLRNLSVDDPSLCQAIGPDPCGFCGVSDAGCKTLLTITRKKTKKKGIQLSHSINSTCEYHHKGMQYRTAAEFHVQKRQYQCSNVPIQCTLCPSTQKRQHPTLWKYNFASHMAEYHMDSEGLFVKCPEALQKATHISVAEAGQLGITREVVQKYCRERDIP
ncbi:hypothetical protein BKA70DRAFT_1027227, partial [Coprinopsis sp. MPI-PUGE-AT-0042]